MNESRPAPGARHSRREMLALGGGLLGVVALERLGDSRIIV